MDDVGRLVGELIPCIRDGVVQTRLIGIDPIAQLDAASSKAFED